MCAYWAAAERLRSDNPEVRAEAEQEVIRLIKRGEEPARLWDEILRTAERRAKLAEMEQRRLREMENTLGVTEVMTLMHVVADVIRRHVANPQTLSDLATALNGVLATRNYEA